MNTRINVNIKALAVLSAVMCLTSCVNDIFGTSAQKAGGVIGVNVSGAGNYAVKSSAPHPEELIGSVLIGDTEDEAFNVEVYAADNDMLPFTNMTKGTIISEDGHSGTGNINSDGSRFTVNGWLGSRNRYPNGDSEGRVNNAQDEHNYHFINDAVATRESGAWTLAPTDKWRNGVPTTFWSWYPVSDSCRSMDVPGDTASDEEQSRLSFSYSTPGQASLHNDLLFAYNLHTVNYDSRGRTDDDELVDIQFHHALSAIRFDVSGAMKCGVTVNRVFFEGVTMEGTCSAYGGSGGSTSSPGVVTFSWTPGSARGTVSQSVGAADFSERSLDGITANALMPMGSDKFFFLIPQPVTGKVKIGITYTRSDGSVQSRTTSLVHDAWKPGKIYTYKLNPAADFVDVEILETVNGAVKSDVYVKNTGNVYEYLRAAVKGNWVIGENASETLIGAWTFSADGFSGLNVGTGMGWTLAADGFFYSNSKVAPGDALKLFDSFTSPAPPSAHAVLNIYVLSQAVAAGTAGSWAEAEEAAKSSGTSTTNQ